MNPFFASAALGLAAAWPVSGLGWLLGRAADRLTTDPAPRARAWSRAVTLPPAALALMAGVSALPQETTAPVYRVVMTSKAVATAGAAVNEASVRALSGVNGVETLGGLLILGALGGLTVAAGRAAIGHLTLKRIVRDSRPASAELAMAVRAAARRLDTGRPEVKISDRIDQPLLAGLATPVILLPAALVARLDIDRLVPICAHELAHLKRGDNWRLLGEHLLGGLFWMAPPYRLLRNRAAAAREELADALALDGADPKARRNYAETLVEVLRARAAPSLHPAFTGKGKPIALRLKAITDPGAPAGFLRKAALGLAAFGAVGVAAAGSIALAQQGDGESGHTRTQIISTNDKQNLTIRSDYVQLNRPTQVVGDKVPVPGDAIAIYVGHVSIRGQLGAGTILLLNGEPAPAGFDPTRLDKDAIRSMAVGNAMEQGRRITRIDVVTKVGG